MNDSEDNSLFVKSTKTDITQDLVQRRSTYSVFQGNDFAFTLGKLSVLEIKVLDFCFSYIQKDDLPNKFYSISRVDILDTLKINHSGYNYQRINKAFKKLKSKEAIVIASNTSFKKEQIKGKSRKLFNQCKIHNGRIEFQFNSQFCKQIFNLHKNFYSFSLNELIKVKSKYALILLKIWNANSLNYLQEATIFGWLDQWEEWFLGEANHYPAGKFKQQVLNVAVKRLKEYLNQVPNPAYHHILFDLNTGTRGNRVVSYTLRIYVNDEEKPALKNSKSLYQQ